jgi:hypothetical protein
MTKKYIALSINEQYVAELEEAVKTAVLHWREVMENDFDQVTGGDTEEITDRLAAIINLD